MDSTLKPAPQRARVLFLTILLSCTLLCCWTAIAVYSPQTGWDFPVFYIAAHLPLNSLYDATAFASYWRTHLKVQGVVHWAPFVRLPLFAIPLHYVLGISYYPALLGWTALGAASYLSASGLLIRRLGLPVALIPACLAYFPALYGILSGADIGFYCLVLVLAVLFLESDRQWEAAIALTLCLSKYHLIALVPLMLVIQKRYRALAGLLLGALLVALSTLCLTSVKTYISALGAAPALAGHFIPVGLRGFTDAIGLPFLFPLLAALVGLTCCWLFYRLDLRDSVAVAVTGTLMISPYVTWYDSALLMIPILTVFSHAGRVIRCLCVFVLIAVPLWIRGGGYGPVGFMHISVEVLLMLWFGLKGERVPVVKQCGGRARTDMLTVQRPLTVGE